MLRGEVTLVFRDVNTGEVTKEIKTPNHICEGFLNELANGNQSDSESVYSGNSGYNGYLNQSGTVCIGTWPIAESSSYVGSVYGAILGYTESGVTSPRYITTTSPRYFEFQQRFNPPSSTRTIHVVGLPKFNTSVSNVGSVPVNAFTKLTTPCTQLTTETLDVFYRIIIEENTTTGIKPVHRMTIADRMWQSRHEYGINLWPCLNVFSYSPRLDDSLWGKILAMYAHGNGSVNSTIGGSYSYTSQHRRRNGHATISLSQCIGRVIGTIGHTYSDTAKEPFIFWNKLLRPTDSPVQNTFPHSSLATKPFYDSSTVAQGGGTINVNGSGWTNPDFPKLLRTEIKSTGEVGTSTYKLSQRNILGFANNTYEEVPSHILNINPWCNSGWESYGNNVLAYDKTRVLFYNDNNMLRVNLVNYKDELVGTLLPTFTPTKIGQVVVGTDGTIWVGCRNTGLYKVSNDLTSVTKFDTSHVALSSLGLTGNSCYAVNIGVSGRVWAVFSGGLITSTDNGNTWSVYKATSTPVFNHGTFASGNSRVHQIVCDKTHVDNRIAIIWDNEASDTNNQYDARISWWDSSVGHVGDVTGVVMAFNNSFTGLNPRLHQFVNWCASGHFFVPICSATTKPAFYTYGTSTRTDITSPYNASTNVEAINAMTSKAIVDKDGNPAMLSMVRVSDNDFRWIVSRPTGVYNLYGTVGYVTGSVPGYVVNVMLFIGQGPMAILDNGIVVFHNVTNWSDGNYNSWYVSMVSSSTHPDGDHLHNLLWEDYGWDGSQWVKGHSGTKQTHNAHEPIIDGLTIKFDDAAGTQQFVNTDYYTTGIVDGVLVDAATEVTYQYAMFYTKKCEFNVTDVEQATIPASTTLNPLAWIYGAQSLTWRDSINITQSSNDLTNTAPWPSAISYARSNQEAHGDFELSYRISSGSGNSSTLGVSNSTRYGTTADPNGIQYALYHGWDGSKYVTTVRKSGVVVATLDTQGYVFDRGNEASMDYRIRRRGNIITFFVNFKEVYSETMSSVEPLHVEWYGWNYINAVGISFKPTYPGTYVDIGSSVNQTGRFDPEFDTIDMTSETGFEFKIDGVPATRISDYNYTTTLQTGQISCFPQSGVVCCSADDAGKTITAKYTVVKFH